MEIIEKIKQTVRKHSMVLDGDRILVSLSGGPDSVCLLYILNILRSPYNLSLHAVYVDHGLRPEETPSEIAFCESLCKELNVDLIVKKIDLASSPLTAELGRQGAARELRYQAVAEEADEAGADRIALGHHKNDQAETLLINLLRGSGVTGLGGMPPVIHKVIRPLIDIEKKEIIEYLSSKNISYMTDSSNLKDDYLRNRVRSRIFPELEELNPGVIDTLSRTSDILREENDYLEAMVTKTMLRLFSRKTDSRVELFLAPMETMPVFLLRRVLRRAVDSAKDLRSLSFRNIEDIIGLVKKGHSGDRIYLPRDLRAIRDYAVLVITSDKPVRLKEYTINEGDEIFIEEAKVLLKVSRTREPKKTNGTSNAVFNLDKISLPLTVRARKDGDFFLPSGFGKRKKIQDFFVDKKIPRDERDAVPLICSQDDIIWVFGHRTDQRFLPDRNTKEFLVISSRPAGK